jgi:hypothetical protein
VKRASLAEKFGSPFLFFLVFFVVVVVVVVLVVVFVLFVLVVEFEVVVLFFVEFFVFCVEFAGVMITDCVLMVVGCVTGNGLMTILLESVVVNVPFGVVIWVEFVKVVVSPEIRIGIGGTNAGRLLLVLAGGVTVSCGVVLVPGIMVVGGGDDLKVPDALLILTCPGAILIVPWFPTAVLLGNAVTSLFNCSFKLLTTPLSDVSIMAGFSNFALVVSNTSDSS